MDTNVKSNRNEEMQADQASLLAEIEALKGEIESLKAEIKDLKKSLAKQETKPEKSLKPGRKSVISEKQIAEIQMLRAQGMTLRAIQKETGLSYGSVQRYCQKLMGKNFK